MPEKNKPISFTNFHKQLPAPFLFMLILSVLLLQKVRSTEIILEYIKNIRHADMGTRWFAHMMIITVNLQKYTEGLTMYMN